MNHAGSYDVELARPPYSVRATMLFLRLNQQRIQYTPRSHKGQRARRIMQRLAMRTAVHS